MLLSIIQKSLTLIFFFASLLGTNAFAKQVPLIDVFCVELSFQSTQGNSLGENPIAWRAFQKRLEQRQPVLDPSDPLIEEKQSDLSLCHSLFISFFEQGEFILGGKQQILEAMNEIERKSSRQTLSELPPTAPTLSGVISNTAIGEYLIVDEQHPSETMLSLELKTLEERSAKYAAMWGEFLDALKQKLTQSPS